jgi:hypothetical protein
MSCRCRCSDLQQQLPSEQESERWPSRHDPADHRGIGGSNIRSQARADAGEQRCPGERPGGQAGTAPHQHRHGRGNHEPVNRDRQKPRAPVLAGQLGQSPLVVVRRDRGDERHRQHGERRNAVDQWRDRRRCILGRSPFRCGTPVGVSTAAVGAVRCRFGAKPSDRVPPVAFGL